MTAPTITAAFRPLPTKAKPAQVPTISQVARHVLVATHPETGELVPVVDMRTYFNERGNGMNPARVNVWVRVRGQDYRSGRGSASGCGYHKESAALAEALDNAGIHLSLAIGGTGSSHYRDVFEAIAMAAGYAAPMTLV